MNNENEQVEIIRANALFDYLCSRNINSWDFPFYALIMAAARKADDKNMRKIEAMWPEAVSQLRKRYNAPGGVLKDEKINLEELAPITNLIHEQYPNRYDVKIIENEEE